MPSFPRQIEYCSMTGQDLENAQQAWEETSTFYDSEQKQWARIVQMIFDETSKVFQMEKFPVSDKGLFGQLIRIQQMLIRNQTRAVTAKE